MNISALVELTNSHSIAISIISLIFSYIIIIALFLMAMFSLIHYIKYRKSPNIDEGKCSALYEGIRSNSLARLYTSLLLTRRLVLAIFIVFIRNGIAQLAVLILTQAVSALFMIIVRPFELLKENLIDIINEFMLLFLVCMFTTLLEDLGLTESEVEIRATAILCVMLVVSLLSGAIISVFTVQDVLGLARALCQKARRRASKSVGNCGDEGR